MILPVVVATWPEARPAAELFFRLSGESRFLLESQSAVAGLARYSFFSDRAFLSFTATDDQLTVSEGDEVSHEVGDPLQKLEELLDRYPVTALLSLPPFCGGAVGYFSYNLGGQLEPAVRAKPQPQGLPDLHLNFYDHLIALDHQTETAYAIAVPLPGHEEVAVQAAKELTTLVRQNTWPTSKATTQSAARPIRSNFTRQKYREAVECAKDYIAKGDIYQVNLSQQFRVPFTESPESVYERLRSANPSPFAAFLDFGPDEQIISASPERFLSYDPLTRLVETRPIKGTRPRGQTPEEDEALKVELLASEKDKAELVMIVDLERNDLGRVSEYGTVRVPDLRRVEPYPTVWHTVATVEGRLRQQATLADLLRATFPGGSITGAPKIRAMQIIDELEDVSRDVYCGAIGYLSFDGHVDLNIAIRTIMFGNGEARFHAGGGIVADSDPAGEYEETLHKALALARALDADLSTLA
jgi:para-aminobenzoate synthetase component I